MQKNMEKKVRAVYAEFVGKTPDQIAQMVREVVNEPTVCHSPSKCAIAAYLVKRLNIDTTKTWISQGTLDLVLGDLDPDATNTIVRVVTPENVTAFIAAFDRGEYPELADPRSLPASKQRELAFV